MDEAETKYVLSLALLEEALNLLEWDVDKITRALGEVSLKAVEEA